ncbi:MAG: uncharacterized membrane protein YbaN (DUF454 family) [Candidatus Azotimanducaceae bacterium]|jgi:uncharacterized membrane protein YbaN (DUF454 family)
MRKTFGSSKQWRRHSREFDGFDHLNSNSRTFHSPVKKLAYVVVAWLMLMIGLAGIIIPVIPGLLFLAAALFYFGKVSPGVKAWSDSHPILGKVNARIDRLGEVKFVERIKIVALMSIEAIASTISAVLTFVRGKVRQRKAEITDFR